jgi:hypothetical protein
VGAYRGEAENESDGQPTELIELHEHLFLRFFHSLKNAK